MLPWLPMWSLCSQFGVIWEVGRRRSGCLSCRILAVGACLSPPHWGSAESCCSSALGCCGFSPLEGIFCILWCRLISLLSSRSVRSCGRPLLYLMWFWEGLRFGHYLHFLVWLRNGLLRVLCLCSFLFCIVPIISFLRRMSFVESVSTAAFFF